jgi:hypothetical protein
LTTEKYGFIRVRSYGFIHDDYRTSLFASDVKPGSLHHKVCYVEKDRTGGGPASPTAPQQKQKPGSGSGKIAA